MLRFKRDNKTELRQICTYCGSNKCKIVGNISARTMKCYGCGAHFDGVADMAERAVYDQQK